MNSPEAFERLHGIIRTLRSLKGCPWDREQSPESLRGNLLEEAYELVEAIDEKDSAHIREETGDLYLVVTMIAHMFEEKGAFTVDESLNAIADKLVRRHPHVFADGGADTPDAVIRQWNEIKERVEGRRRKDSVLDEVSRALPPLERAFRLQKKAAGAGFDWPDAFGVFGKLREETAEAEAALASGDRTALEAELGDILFSAVNLSRYLGVDPSVALLGAVERFIRRFRRVEEGMAREGRRLMAENLVRMDELWNEAKAEEAGAAGKPR
ncbi:MAG TPA: nucleoside triphosphate pyrophosphohydrolase [Magnetospirillaceae bacterium]|nr:nucleoside triphosphate pyrophosphohydrolase [Magnetospirillaceae bacterium]